MDARQRAEYTYYDLQELSFIPSVSDEDRAWVDKVLTLGHPDDWPEGVDYTSDVHTHKEHLMTIYHTLPTIALDRMPYLPVPQGMPAAVGALMRCVIEIDVTAAENRIIESSRRNVVDLPAPIDMRWVWIDPEEE